MYSRSAPPATLWHFGFPARAPRGSPGPPLRGVPGPPLGGPPGAPRDPSGNRVPGRLPRLRGGSAWRPGPPGPPPAQACGPPGAPSRPLPPGAKNRRFLTPCGAKSWGSGGAPPTNLILLRNQRRARLGTTARRTEPPGPTRGPTRPPQAPPGPPWPRGWWWLAVGGGGGGGGGLERGTGGGRGGPLVILVPRTGRCHLRLRQAPTAALAGARFAPFAVSDAVAIAWRLWTDSGHRWSLSLLDRDGNSPTSNSPAAGDPMPVDTRRRRHKCRATVVSPNQTSVLTVLVFRSMSTLL